MKKFWKYIAIATCTVVMAPLTSCDDDELGPKDKANYEANFAYFVQPNSTFAEVEYKANGDFISGITDPLKLVPVRLTKPAPSNINVEIAIDPTLVDEYNAAKGTDYIFLEGAEIDNPMMSVEAGKYISTDIISISFGDHSGFINQEKDLILPIVVKGGNGLTPSKSGRIFLTFKSTYRPNYLTIPSENMMFKAGIMNDGWEESIKTINVNNAFALSYAPYEEVTVNFAIDQSKVAAYNEANGTDYEFKADAELVSNTLTLGTEENWGSFAINTGDLTGIANEGSYIIPVTITSVEGASVELTEGNQTIYVMVKGVGREMSISETGNGGVLFKATACTVDGNDSYTGGWSPSTWIDIIDHESYSYGYVSKDSKMEIDFGDVVNLTSFYINHYSASYAPTSMTLETSADGNKWIDWGEVSYPDWKNPDHYVNLSAPEKVRYMRIVFTGVKNSYYGVDIEHLKFFKQQ